MWSYYRGGCGGRGRKDQLPGPPRVNLLEEPEHAAARLPAEASPGPTPLQEAASESTVGRDRRDRAGGGEAKAAVTEMSLRIPVG